MVILVMGLSRCRFTCAPTPRKGDQVFIIHPYSNPCLLRIGINFAWSDQGKYHTDKECAWLSRHFHR